MIIVKPSPKHYSKPGVVRALSCPNPTVHLSVIILMPFMISTRGSTENRQKGEKITRSFGLVVSRLHLVTLGARITKILTCRQGARSLHVTDLLKPWGRRGCNLGGEGIESF